MAASSPLYKLVDIGANLAHPLFQKDYADVLSRSRQAGSSGMNFLKQKESRHCKIDDHGLQRKVHGGSSKIGAERAGLSVLYSRYNNYFNQFVRSRIIINEIIKKEQFIFSNFPGIHPHDAKDFVDGQTLDFLRSHLLDNDGQCVAVGECGLDFNRNFSPRDQQLAVFEKQVFW